MRPLLFLVFLVPQTIGCATTTVKKNPGEHDHGIRFYRPKPYLLLEPAVVENSAVPNMVKITLNWLPDFNEEYSVRVRAGLGTNTTEITLDKGWNLTGLNIDVDSKTSENVSAIAGALGNFAPTGAAKQKRTIAQSIPAHNVPLGFYEAVFSESCGEKRIHGWRYVGFTPYTPCPIVPAGSVQPDTCQDGNVYGLISEGGTMVFKRLDGIKTTPVKAIGSILVPDQQPSTSR